VTSDSSVELGDDSPAGSIQAEADRIIAELIALDSGTSSTIDATDVIDLTSSGDQIARRTAPEFGVQAMTGPAISGPDVEEDLDDLEYFDEYDELEDEEDNDISRTAFYIVITIIIILQAILIYYLVQTDTLNFRGFGLMISPEWYGEFTRLLLLS
jgi:hypothetical protein